MKPLLILLLILSLTPSAFSISALLSGPQLPFPKDSSKISITEVLTFLQKEVTFLDGRFINQFTSQNYAAPTEKISELLTLFHRKGFTVHLTFFKKDDSKIAFQISTDGGPQGTLTIGINSAAPDFNPLRLKLTVPPTVVED